MSYTIYRITAWNGKREQIGTAETAREAAALCEADRQAFVTGPKYDRQAFVTGPEYAHMISYDIIGKENPSVKTD